MLFRLIGRSPRNRRDYEQQGAGADTTAEICPSLKSLPVTWEWIPILVKVRFI